MSSNNFSVPVVHGSDVEDDELDEPLSQHQCVACKTMSPATKSAHTLISAQHGWRVVRTKLAEGGFLYEWHCPGCWVRLRQQKVNPL